MDPAYATLSVKVKGNVPSKVSLDGEPLGDAPIESMRVPNGNVKLRVTPRDTTRYSPFQKKLALGLKDQEVVEAECTARMGQVVISTDPPEADLFIDGESKGQSPLKISLFQGEHTVEAKYPKYAAAVKRFKVEEGEVSRLSLSLSSDPQLVISCSPQGEIFINQTQVGSDQVTVSRKPGEYNVRCEFAGVSDQRTVRLNTEDRREINLRIMSGALKKQEERRANDLGWAWIHALLSGVFVGSAIYVGQVAIPSKMDEQKKAGGRLDANRVWGLDDELSTLNTTVIALGVGAGVFGALSAYYLWTAPPKIELKERVGEVSAQWFVAPTSVGVTGQW
jgi:hypothetical protein